LSVPCPWAEDWARSDHKVDGDYCWQMAAFSNSVLGLKMFRCMSPASDCGEKIKLKLVFFRKKKTTAQTTCDTYVTREKQKWGGGAHSTRIPQYEPP